MTKSNKIFFNIIIPCYNSGGYIKKCIESVLKQTFQDFMIYVINDKTPDDSFEIAKKLSAKTYKIMTIEGDKKLFIGGARNVGIELSNIEGSYTLFLDNDDWFDDDKCLEEIHNIIVKNNYPDCVRLSYKCITGDTEIPVILRENTPKDLVNSLYIAPWTKCIKSDLIVNFPENTLIEDVVQHIAQVDKINTIAVCEKPIVCWNRNNTLSCSLQENQKKLQNGKRISSVYRNIADLMDLQCEHDYCEQHRLWRLQCYKNLIREGKEETF